MTDLAIIGAGPAGMAAAARAGDLGLSCVLIDEQPAPGGQIYRGVTMADDRLTAILGEDYAEGRTLVSGLNHPSVSYLPGATVWQIDPDNRITLTDPDGPRQIDARHILLATGALERPVPIPGWTLPGVMTAGAAQILLKQSALSADGAVLVGCGPLLYLLATQLIRAGTPPRALVETQPRGAYLAALRHMPRALRNLSALRKGQQMLRAIRRAGVSRYIGARDLEITGPGQATTLRFRQNGRAHEIKAGLFLLHAGVVPNTQITSALGLAHRWNAANQCFEPATDAQGAVPDRAIHIAGDGAAILGAGAAQLSGALAVTEIAHARGLIGEAQWQVEAQRLRTALERERAIRPLLETLYPPPAQILRPADSTIICRCEEVTAGTLRQIARAGCAGPNQAKSFCRAGMGPCQGRFCGATTTQVLAQANGVPPAQIGYLNQRFPTKPLTLGELARLAAEDRVDI